MALRGHGVGRMVEQACSSFGSEMHSRCSCISWSFPGLSKGKIAYPHVLLSFFFLILLASKYESTSR